MREIRVEKVVLNIGVGAGGDKLAKAEKVIEMIAEQRPSRTLAKKSVRDWGVKLGEPIGCRVTLRGELAAFSGLTQHREALTVGYNYVKE